MRRTPIATIKRAPSKLKEYIFKFDFLLFFSMLFLLGVGLIFIYSTGFQNEVVVDSSFFYKQLFWITISLPLYLVLSNFDYRYLKSLAVPLYLLSLLLLIAVLFIGVKIYGAKRWLDLGFSNFQPSELMKLSLILILSTFFCRRNFDINRFENLFVIGLLTLIPFILIFVEPDFGSALILLPLAFGMIFAAGIKKKYIFIGVGIFAFFATLLTLNEVFEIKPLLKNYHRNRIMAFIDADKAPKDLTHQSRQAAIAVATGGLSGKGLGNGTQHTLGFLPRTAANNDFIFAVIAEETGFAGAFCLIVLFGVLILSCFAIAWRAPDIFGRVLASGFGTMLFCHVFVNIGMNINLAPVTGIPLPLVSYGGTFLVTTMAMLGILQSISRTGALLISGR